MIETASTTMMTDRQNDTVQTTTTKSGGLMGLFRRISRKAGPSASLPPPPPPPPIASTSSVTLQRRATTSAVTTTRRTFSMRRKHRHGTLADMARSQSSEEPDSNAAAAAAAALASTGPAPLPPHARRRHVQRAFSESTPHAQAVVPVWGPPPALRSSASSGSVTSQTDALLQGGGSSTAWNGMTLAEERALHRRSMRSPPMPRDLNRSLSPALSTGGGLGRSSSISSTTRGRSTGRPLLTAEQNKRSSQFIGQWCLATSISEQSILPEAPIDTRHRSLSSPTNMQPHPPTYWASVLEDVHRVQFGPAPLPGDGTYDSLLSAELVEEADDDDDDYDSAHEMEQLDSFTSDDSPRNQQRRETSPCFTDCHSSPTSSPVKGPVWAVSRGWRTGVYATYDEAHDQLRGFPGPVARQFDSTAAAEEWLRDDALHAQRVPSIRTLAIDEQLAEARKSSATTQQRRLSAAIVDPDVLQSIVQRSVSLRRIASPPPPA